MRLPSSPPLPIGAFILNYITIKLNYLTDNLIRDARTLAQLLQTPNYKLQTHQDIVPLGRILRTSRLSRGLNALVSDTPQRIVDPATNSPTQIARHRGINNAYEVAAHNMRLARRALVDMLETQFGIEYKKGMIGDPAEVGTEVHLLRQAMFGEVTDDEQTLIVEGWVAEAKAEYAEFGGRERAPCQDVDVGALIAGPARS